MDQITAISPGIKAALEERKRQIFDKGMDAKHDDAANVAGELCAAAGCYATAAWDVINGFAPDNDPIEFPESWDFAWWRPSADPKRNLVKAMALLAAEYDRLERAEKESEDDPS